MYHGEVRCSSNRLPPTEIYSNARLERQRRRQKGEGFYSSFCFSHDAPRLRLRVRYHRDNISLLENSRRLSRYIEAHTSECLGLATEWKRTRARIVTEKRSCGGEKPQSRIYILYVCMYTQSSKASSYRSIRSSVGLQKFVARRFSLMLVGEREN